MKFPSMNTLLTNRECAGMLQSMLPISMLSKS